MSSSMLEQANVASWVEAMKSGDFETAWRCGDAAFKLDRNDSSKPLWQRAVWQGEPLAGRHLLVRCWRGLGDTIHFIRYAEALRPQVKSVHVEVEACLIPLLSRIPAIDCFYPLDLHGPMAANSIPSPAVELEVTEFPFACRTNRDTIPAACPYLSRGPRQRSNAPSDLRVGLCWRGGTFDSRRAVPLEQLMPVRNLPGIRLWHLQRGDQAEKEWIARFSFVNQDRWQPTILKTAELIEGLDLVISVDTMVAHLAGALGVPVWTLLHADPDWRWMREGSSSPWYPTMRLFRQRVAGDWEPVIREVVEQWMRTLAGK